MKELQQRNVNEFTEVHNEIGQTNLTRDFFFNAPEYIIFILHSQSRKFFLYFSNILQHIFFCYSANTMKILAIETSCDETAVALIESKKSAQKTAFVVHASEVASQIAMHQEYGGVFPTIAKREHAKACVPLLENTLHKAGLIKKLKHPNLDTKLIKKLTSLLEREPELLEAILNTILAWQKPKIDAIAVTSGPGLEPALWVGINFARALSLIWDISVYPINHMEGHIFASVLQEEKAGTKKIYTIPHITFPAVSLLISGGHTELVHIKNWMKYKVIGQTRDDAAGEAFDKVARMLGLPYPGGPQISKLAQPLRTVRPNNLVVPTLPRPMIHSKDLDFSFSGLKTAVLYLLQKIEKLTPKTKQVIAYEFENAVTEVLVKKSLDALKKTSAKTLIVGGGVSANTNIREALAEACHKADVTLYLPDRALSTDNALMIATTAYYQILHGKKPKKTITANGSWGL